MQLLFLLKYWQPCVPFQMFCVHALLSRWITYRTYRRMYVSHRTDLLVKQHETFRPHCTNSRTTFKLLYVRLHSHSYSHTHSTQLWYRACGSALDPTEQIKSAAIFSLARAKMLQLLSAIEPNVDLASQLRLWSVSRLASWYILAHPAQLDVNRAKIEVGLFECERKK